MLKRWLRNKLLLIFLFVGKSIYGQNLTDTLKEFVKEEVITDLQSFSTLNLTDSTSKFKSLDKLLETSSTVYVKNYGKGQLATLSIRGNGSSQTQLFWNGFKMNSPTLGQSDLSLIPAFFLNDIALNYSGGSSVNGSGGIGGSLNLSTKLNWRKGFHGSYGKELASFSNSTSTYGLSYGTNKAYNEVKVLSRKGENNFKFIDISKKEKPIARQTNNVLSQLGVQYKTGFQLNNKNLLQGTVLFFDSYREIPPIIGGVSNKEFQEDQYWKSFISWKNFQTRFNSDVRVSFFNEKLDYTDSNSSIFSNTLVETYQGQYRINFNLFKEIKVESSFQSSYSEVKSSGYEGRKKRKESSLYAKISQKWNNWYYEVFVRQELLDKNWSPLVYGGGVTYKMLKDKLKLKTNLSKNYRAATLNDLYWSPGGNRDLLPEDGWTSELGAVYTHHRRFGNIQPDDTYKLREYKISAELVGFYNQTSNWIQWQPTDKGYWSPKNVKSIENKGVEAGILYSYKSMFSTVTTRLNYSYTDSRNVEFTSNKEELLGKQTVYVPKHKVSFFGQYQYKKWGISYSQIYTSKVFIDASNSTYLPHYFPADIRMDYFCTFRKFKLKLGGGVNNVYNEPYQVVANRPLAGRNYQFFINLEF